MEEAQGFWLKVYRSNRQYDAHVKVVVFSKHWPPSSCLHRFKAQTSGETSDLLGIFSSLRWPATPFALWAAKSLKAEWWREKKTKKQHRGPSAEKTSVMVCLLWRQQETKKEEEPQVGDKEEKWRAPVVSRKHLTTKIQCELVIMAIDGVLREVFYQRNRTYSYILCLLKFKPPNPKATIPTKSSERCLWNTF